MNKSILVVIFVVLILAIAGVAKVASNPKQTVAATPTTVPSSIPTAAANPVSPAPTSSSSATLKDGTYTGKEVSIVYGTVQASLIISGGRITDVRFNKMPSETGRTDEVTASARPVLLQETLTAQSGDIATVSGATQTSEAFIQSIAVAFSQAKNT